MRWCHECGKDAGIAREIKNPETGQLVRRYYCDAHDPEREVKVPDSQTMQQFDPHI